MRSKTKFKQTEIGLVPEDWRVQSIDTIAEIIGGGTPLTTNPEYWNGDIVWITPKDLSNSKFRYIGKGNKNITEKGLENSSAKLIRKNTILLTTRAPVGYLAISKNRVSTNQGFRSLVPNDKVDTEFLFYLLKNNVEILKSNSSGTTFGELSGSRLKALKFAFPKISEQKSISKILSDLDSKIELNHKMNQILEQIAQTVFKSWFVDYEFPDEDGKPYRSSGGEMAYSSEMGKKIPKGWRRRKYSELAEVKTGKSLKPKELVRHGKFPIMGANGELGRTNAFLFNKELILTGRVGTLGRVYIVNGKSWISDNVLISDTKSKDFFYYAYYTLKGFDFISLNRGSTQPLITQTDLKNYPCLIPDKTTLLLFNKISLSIFNKIFSLKIQNKNIAQIRDSLLPKLMSGKIRIPS